MAPATITQPFAAKTYSIIVHVAKEGGYWAEVKGLPGCVSQGETLEELHDNILEAMDAVIGSSCQPSSSIQTEPVLGEKSYFAFGYGETWTVAQ